MPEPIRRGFIRAVYVWETLGHPGGASCEMRDRSPMADRSNLWRSRTIHTRRFGQRRKLTSLTGGKAVGHYKSNVRDIEFNLFEVFHLDEILCGAEFGHLDGDTVRTMLAEAARQAEGPLADPFADVSFS